MYKGNAVTVAAKEGLASIAVQLWAKSPASPFKGLSVSTRGARGRWAGPPRVSTGGINPSKASPCHSWRSGWDVHIQQPPLWWPLACAWWHVRPQPLPTRHASGTMADRHMAAGMAAWMLIAAYG